jgi:hypothetical protein
MKRVLAVVVLVLFVPLASCADDDDGFGPGALGAPCRGNFDCPSRCEEGFCTFSCSNDAQCPQGWACVDPHGGICSAMCGPNGCGPGYRCESTKRHGAGGDVMVCRG